jgi:hypothetical protein
LEWYCIEAPTDFSGIVVLATPSLRVNGVTPLEEWLPYSVVAGTNVKVSRNTVRVDWENLDWDKENARTRQDYPKEKVQYLKAEGGQRLVLNFQPKEEKKTPKQKP